MFYKIHNKNTIKIILNNLFLPGLEPGTCGYLLFPFTVHRSAN